MNPKVIDASSIEERKKEPEHTCIPKSSAQERCVTCSQLYALDLSFLLPTLNGDEIDPEVHIKETLRYSILSNAVLYTKTTTSIQKL